MQSEFLHRNSICFTSDFHLAIRIFCSTNVLNFAKFCHFPTISSEVFPKKGHFQRKMSVIEGVIEQIEDFIEEPQETLVMIYLPNRPPQALERQFYICFTSELASSYIWTSISFTSFLHLLYIFLLLSFLHLSSKCFTSELTSVLHLSLHLTSICFTS